MPHDDTWLPFDTYASDAIKQKEPAKMTSSFCFNCRLWIRSYNGKLIALSSVKENHLQSKVDIYLLCYSYLPD
ncbi:MAG: hypothetical protein JWR38_3753 [Mucilaginibacter sp.]|nr:hypothetical protein [Mucilaginibacter sp.]